MFWKLAHDQWDQSYRGGKDQGCRQEGVELERIVRIEMTLSSSLPPSTSFHCIHKCIHGLNSCHILPHRFCPSVAETDGHLGVVSNGRRSGRFSLSFSLLFSSREQGGGSEEWQPGATQWWCWGRLKYVSSSLPANKCGFSFFLQ